MYFVLPPMTDEENFRSVLARRLKLAHSSIQKLRIED